MMDPSGDFRDGSDDRAFCDIAAFRHCVILRWFLLLGWMMVRELTKARQAIVKGNIAVCVMCEAKKGEAMATNDL